VPLDKQSIVASAPGLPWWGVVLCGAGLTTLGFLMDAARGSELTAAFSTLYFLGCVLAGAAASNRALFTAMVQPPLLLIVAVPIAQSIVGPGMGTGIKNIAFNVAYPLVNRFPVMLGATVVVLAICGARLFLLQQRRNGPARASDRRRGSRTNGESAKSRRPRPATRRSDEPASRSQTARKPAPRPQRPVSDGKPRREAAMEPTPTRRRPGSADDMSPRPRPRRGAPGRPDPSASRRGYPDRGAPMPPAQARVPRDAAQPARPRQGTAVDVPAHPIPQVRYRDRYEPPFESERP